jgi:hypothetical protein
MTVRSLENVAGLGNRDSAWARPYRISAIEEALKQQSLPAGTTLSIEPIHLALEEEKRLFPKFTFDRYYVHVQNRKGSYSISGLSEWGVFWYRVDEGAPQHPDRDALFWGTIDRLSSVAEFLAARL